MSECNTGGPVVGQGPLVFLKHDLDDSEKDILVASIESCATNTHNQSHHTDQLADTVTNNYQTSTHAESMSDSLEHVPDVSLCGDFPKRNSVLEGTSKRFQQLWFAVKRFSSIHKVNKDNQFGSHSSTPRRKFPKHNIDCDVNQDTVSSKIRWSPFTRRRQTNKHRHKLYSSHPDISSTRLHDEVFLQDTVANIMLESSKTDENDGSTMASTANRWDPSSFMNKSPLNRIKKIKRDMRRCVQRVTNSEYELHDQSGSSGLISKTSNQTNNQVQLVSAKLTDLENESKYALHHSTGENTPITQVEKRLRLRKAETVDEYSVSNLNDDLDFERIDSNELLTQNCDMQTHEEISLEKAQNYETFLHRQRISKLLQYPFFQVDIHLRHAQNLLAKDACGTSDPYVKFKVGNQVVQKSRIIFKTLNPKWDEYFVIPIDDIFEPIVLKAYDHDYLLVDDYLGTAQIDLTSLEPGISTELELFLHENYEAEKAHIDSGWGKLYLTVKLNPKTQQEKEHFYGRGKWVTSYGADGPCKKVRTQLWDSVVNVLLIKGGKMYLENDYCIKFKLGTEKYKSKIMAKSVNEPYWAEQFDMHLYADQSKVLEISLCAANQSTVDFVEKTCIDLSELATEQTHNLVQKFNATSQWIELLITITGCQQTVSNSLANQPFGISFNQIGDLSKQYNVFHSLHNISNVGRLIVKVYKAENLAAADINGKSDPFCVLQLVNDRLRTGTEYKTLSPEWNKSFSFNFKDIHSVLEVTIYDEDRDRVEFLGKVAIPLLKIKNGEKKWFALKDKKLRHRVKGHILLEMWISFNKFKASLRTFIPREQKYVQPEVKFKRALFVRNATRLKNICMELLQWGQFMHSCIQWESPTRSLVAFICFLTFVYFFELYMFPLMLLLIILKNYIQLKFETYMHPNLREEEVEYLDENSFDDDDEDRTEEKKTLKEKLQTVQEISTVVMNILGEMASFFERIKNTSNFSVPFLSWLAVICLTLATLILYQIPIRYLILVWGINKFTKKFRAPHAIDNNELLDFLSRVPDMEEKVMYKEFKPTVSVDTDSNNIPSQSSQSPTNSITGTADALRDTQQSLLLSDKVSTSSAQFNTSNVEKKTNKKK